MVVFKPTEINQETFFLIKGSIQKAAESYFAQAY